ncbi:MAG: dolichyl-phosphate mannose synthase [Leptospiraceae bacterium]|nr:MAG: dolichyl-phosphate mannose synthase [Leptospiraceae bacterium]GIX43540.1 MAG: dolichyl-phosphate mannose synthase [Leptospiraceae bacterium]
MNILLGIPVYNEEENINPFFEHLFSKLPEEINKIIVINDGSTDNSKKLLENIKKKYDNFSIEIIHRYPNLGYGASMIFLLDYAKQNHFDFLITMDCDRQHRVEDLKRFIKQPFSFDVVSGSRYLPNSPKCGIDPPKDRLKVNQKITLKLNQIYHFRLTDSFCGFKRYKLEKIHPECFEEKGYGFPLEFWSYCYYFKLSIKEIPVARVYITDDRSFGENLDKYKIRYKYYLNVLKKANKKFQQFNSELCISK